MNALEHLLVVTGEEACEVVEAFLLCGNTIPSSALRIQKAAMKAGRFGLNEQNPLTHDSPLQNLITEYNDLMAAFELLQEFGVAMPGLGDREAIEEKKAKVRSMMAISASRGLLELPEEL